MARDADWVDRTSVLNAEAEEEMGTDPPPARSTGPADVTAAHSDPDPTAGGRDRIAGSAKRRPASEVAPPVGAGGLLKFVWAVLTSMRTALILLFALAVAAIPGGILPQRPANPIAVKDWLTAHPGVGPVLDRIGMFDVFHAPWFAAIYLLLFVSLIGCILPRAAVYLRSLRTPPARPPRALERMRGSARLSAAASADLALDTAAAHLRRSRFRVVRRGDTVAAERGYLREGGNLIFHIAIVGILLGVAWGSVFGFRGTAIVVEGQGFSNTLTQYDDITAGAFFSPADLEPFTVSLDTFHVKFETGPVQRGAARVFAADVAVTEPRGRYDTTIEVNHPLRVGQTSVHLVGHGYAPVVTVLDGAGDVAFSGPVVFLPQDGNFTSAGAVNARDARPQRVAFEGWFLPSAVVDGQGPRSIFPDTLNPELFLNAWAGPPAAETGRPQNVYVLDRSGLTQLRTPDGEPVRIRLKPGETYVLPDGAGVITFDGWQRWTKLQLSRTPGMGFLLGSLVVAVLGMTVSLTVRPRRVWIKAVAAADGGSLIHVAGLDRAEGRSGLGNDLAALAAAVGAGPSALPGDADRTDQTPPEETT